MAKVEVRGARQIADTLRGIGRSVSPAAVRRAHQEALEPMQASARANFTLNGSYKTGVVPADIAIVHTGARESKLGMTGMGASLGHLIELGTAPHAQPNRRSVHPGASPKPFMRPAFDSTAPTSLRLAGGVYAAELMRIAGALRRR